MIYIDPGERRADTMTIVNEGCAARHYATGEFKLIAKACGYTELVMRNLAAFYDAGVIEPSPKPADRVDNGDWEILRWTKTGHYLWQQWREGPPRAVIELPVANQTPAGDPPEFWTWDALAGHGYDVENYWRVPYGWVVECARMKNEGRQEAVALTNNRGQVLRIMPRDEAAMWAAAILAAAR